MCAGFAALQAQQQHATAQTRGIAPLVQSAVLTDRRHILTKDAEGNVELWDTATAAVKERFGQVPSCLVHVSRYRHIHCFPFSAPLSCMYSSFMFSRYGGKGSAGLRDCEMCVGLRWSEVS